MLVVFICTLKDANGLTCYLIGVLLLPLEAEVFYRGQSHEPELEPDEADEDAEQHLGHGVGHPRGEVDGLTLELLDHALEHKVGAGAGERARAAGVGRVRHRQVDHVADVGVALRRLRAVGAAVGGRAAGLRRAGLHAAQVADATIEWVNGKMTNGK